MNTRQIVGQAWQLTQAHLKKLIWYGALPSFFVMVISSIYLGYQYDAFRNSPLFSDEQNNFLERFAALFELMGDNVGLSIVLTILALLFFLGYVIFPPIFRGVLIRAWEHIRVDEDIKGSMEVGIRHFFPLFEFGLLTAIFGISTLFSSSSLILRWWGEGAFFIALPFFLIWAMIGFVVNFLFTYSEYYIVLEGKRVIESIKESVILVLANLRETFLILILMVLIAVQIVLRAILVLLIPMLVAAAATFFATKSLTIIALIIVGLVSLLILIASAYSLGLFNIFKTAVWVLTFGILRQKPSGKKEEA